VSCDADNEDVVHLLFECPFAVQVWQMSGLWHEIQQAITFGNSAADTIFYLLQHFTLEQSQVLAATIWSLWKHRNLQVWENKNEPCAMTVDRARVLLE